ncbi:MAG: hypothetical protein H6739_18190 [Alphaproteobacteria bacterium]|nr:hypothetical protein [Alphaproteobacteria bacterium]
MPLLTTPPSPPVHHIARDDDWADREERRQQLAKEHPGAIPAGTVDLRLHGAFDSQLPGPAGIGLAFASWMGGGLAVDLCVARDRAVALTVGGEGVLAGAPVVSALAGRTLESELGASEADFSTRHLGGAVRVGAHLDPWVLSEQQRFSGFDPYALFVAGYSAARADLSFAVADEGGVAGVTAAGARAGGGLGLNHVGERGLLWGIELRYLASRTGEATRSADVNPPSLEQEVFRVMNDDALQSAQTVPTGFSWTFALGWRL